MSWKDDVEENIKCGLIEILILSLLSHEDMYGYRLKTELAERTSHTFIVKEGSLYGPLYRMQERGLISSHKELVGEKRFRNYYHIEEAGKEYLQYAVQQFLLIYDGANQLIQGVNIDEDTKPKGDL